MQRDFRELNIFPSEDFEQFISTWLILTTASVWQSWNK